MLLTWPCYTYHEDEGQCLMKRILLMVLLALALLPAGAPSHALTYECADATGKIIFTDSLSQLKNCAAAASASSAQAPGPRLLEPFPIQPTPGAVAPLLQPAVSGPAPVAGSITIPLAKVGRSLVVRARLNGARDARLIVDTGAEITVLSHAVALDAGLLPSQTVATVTLNTVGGSVRADVFRVGSVSLGEAEVRNVTAAIHDLSDAPDGIDGLLGLTFLDKFLVTLDTQKGELHLRTRP
jgi:clan AA aspartic protease (TIGR02281 family)